ncbi:hypothetical protein GOODEAATRI_009777 [Goodea atripinnis]|uniref:Uncharacterized protein n=1 Tax=Goodea atripinnis TaxID=208336 RepID=A0ABV0PM78_9TELE
MDTVPEPRFGAKLTDCDDPLLVRTLAAAFRMASFPSSGLLKQFLTGPGLTRRHNSTRVLSCSGLLNH